MRRLFDGIGVLRAQANLNNVRVLRLQLHRVPVLMQAEAILENRCGIAFRTFVKRGTCLTILTASSADVHVCGRYHCRCQNRSLNRRARCPGACRQTLSELSDRGLPETCHFLIQHISRFARGTLRCSRANTCPATLVAIVAHGVCCALCRHTDCCIHRVKVDGFGLRFQLCEKLATFHNFLNNGCARFEESLVNVNGQGELR